MSAAWTTVPSPVGELLLLGEDGRLTGLHLPGEPRRPAPQGSRDDGAFAEPRRQLEEYFAGHRTAFELALAPAGTPFRQCVWTALRRIPYGSTITYTELAALAGRPAAIRAAGAANGANPISIVIPCHRVIGTSGSLTGYAGGLDAKRFLLAHERALA